MSKALKQIEIDLKLQLFARTNGRLIPTPEAEALYPEVTKALRGFKAFRTVADAVRDGQIGGLSVGAIPTFSNSLLPEAVARFGRGHPSLRISIYAISARELIDSVQSAHVDFGMLNSTSDPGICDTEDLGSSEIVCIMPRGHPLAALPVIQPRDLQQCCLIGYESRFPFFDVIARAFKKARIPYTPRIEVGSSIFFRASSIVAAGSASSNPLC